MLDKPTKQKSFRLSFWPSPQDYNEAMQAHSTSVVDAELREAEPELNELGIPKAVSGGFASVYKLTAKSTDYAVRCFLCPVPDREHRYQSISEHLQNVQVQQLASFQYLPTGVQIGGSAFPIIKMDWISGETLDRFIERNHESKNTMERLCSNFVTMIERLEQAGIAHGDLQHGNILVTPDAEIKLVDYDGMFVPQLLGQRSCELGHSSYQHPQRNENHFDCTIDRFSALLIFCSLRALCVDAALVQRLSNFNDKLLFRAEDLRNPEHSEIFYSLENNENEELNHLSKLIRMCLLDEMQTVPTLKQIADLKVSTELPPFKLHLEETLASDSTNLNLTLSEKSSPEGNSNILLSGPTANPLLQKLATLPPPSLPPPARGVRYNWSARKTYCPIIYLLVLMCIPPMSFPTLPMLASFLTQTSMQGEIIEIVHGRSVPSKIGLDLEYRFGNRQFYSHVFVPKEQASKYRIGSKIQVRDSWLLPQAPVAPTTTISEKDKAIRAFLKLCTTFFLLLYLFIAFLLWMKPLRHLELVRNGVATTGIVTAKRKKGDPDWNGQETELYSEMLEYSFEVAGAIYTNQQYMPSNQAELFNEGAPLTIIFDKANPKVNIIYELAFFQWRA